MKNDQDNIQEKVNFATTNLNYNINKEIDAQNFNPLFLLEKAIEKGIDVNSLEKLLALKERWDAQEAKKKFFDAFCNFQKECPIIKKDKTAIVRMKTGGQYQYKYASLESITETISLALSNNNLSYRWEQKENGKISVSCIISHNAGHSESTTIESSVDKMDKRSDIQSLAATITYLRRYTLTSALGISTAEDDSDGIVGYKMKNEYEKISESQYSTLIDLLNETDTKESAFCNYLSSLTKVYDIQDLKNLPLKMFEFSKSKLVQKLEKIKVQELENMQDTNKISSTNLNT